MLEAIAQRASVRSYKPEPVSDEDIQTILEAALHAPSANNARPWHIVVVRDEVKRQQLSQVHQWASFCTQSPVVLVFCAEESCSPHWWIEDLSAAVENALIQASALGLGTCWIGIRGGGPGHALRPEEHVRKVCDIPEGIRVLAIVSLGYPTDSPHAKQPGPMSNVHDESW
ncbi:MAG: nitroreductase family protein [Armatimonadetes bacterium]|nr:nitroreductase family protein [Armatimonadota bacterium]